jgi:hypothetical protein
MLRYVKRRIYRCVSRFGKTWHSIVDHTDAGLLADATLWAATSPTAQNQAFNVNNGDIWRWCELWPRIASWFELASAPPVRLSFHQLFVDYRAHWRELAGQSLVEADILRLSDGKFADFVFGWNYDMFGDGSKLRRAGFTEMQATDDMFFRLFAQLSRAHYPLITPPPDRYSATLKEPLTPRDQPTLLFFARDSRFALWLSAF